MLLLTLLAFFSTIAFYRRGKQVGVSPGRAASLPFIVLGIFLTLEIIGAHLIAYLGKLADVSNSTLLTMAWVFYIFLILAYLQFINRNWKVLTQTDKAND